MPIDASTPYNQYQVIRQLDRIEKKLNKLLRIEKVKKK